MVRALALLLVCQLAGEVAVRAAGLAIPGPVVGLALLVVGLMAAARLGGPACETVDATELGRTASALLAVIGILFVPAGVGLIQHLPLLVDHGLALAAALLGSTVLTLIVTVRVFVAVSRLTGGSGAP